MIKIKAWRRPTAVFEERGVTFIPQYEYTFIKKDDKSYLLPIGLTNYQSYDTNDIATNMVCFNKNKYGLSWIDLTNSLVDMNYDNLAEFIIQATNDSEHKVVSLDTVSDTLKVINENTGISIPSQEDLASIYQAHKGLTSELMQVAGITQEFIKHMVNSGMVKGLIDPNLADQVIKDYGKDKKHDNVLH